MSAYTLTAVKTRQEGNDSENYSLGKRRGSLPPPSSFVQRYADGASHSALRIVLGRRPGHSDQPRLKNWYTACTRLLACQVRRTLSATIQACHTALGDKGEPPVALEVPGCEFRSNGEDIRKHSGCLRLSFALLSICSFHRNKVGIKFSACPRTIRTRNQLSPFGA